MIDAILVHPWPWWVAGLAVGAYVILLAALTGKALGVSTGVARCCGLVSRAGYFHSGGNADGWRGWFVVGLPLGGLLAALGAGMFHPTPGVGATTAPLATMGLPVWLVLGVGGAMVGYGSRWAGGCTSGHGVVGTALGARSSWVATMAFMGGAILLTQVLIRVVGGAA